MCDTDRMQHFSGLSGPLRRVIGLHSCIHITRTYIVRNCRVNYTHAWLNYQQRFLFNVYNVFFLLLSRFYIFNGFYFNLNVFTSMTLMRYTNLLTYLLTYLLIYLLTMTHISTRTHYGIIFTNSTDPRRSTAKLLHTHTYRLTYRTVRYYIPASSTGGRRG